MLALHLHPFICHLWSWLIIQSVNIIGHVAVSNRFPLQVSPFPIVTTINRPGFSSFGNFGLSSDFRCSSFSPSLPPSLPPFSFQVFFSPTWFSWNSSVHFLSHSFFLMLLLSLSTLPFPKPLLCFKNSALSVQVQDTALLTLMGGAISGNLHPSTLRRKDRPLPARWQFFLRTKTNLLYYFLYLPFKATLGIVKATYKVWQT